MKAGVFAISTLVLVITLVSINSNILKKSLTSFIEDAEDFSVDAYDSYSRAEKMKRDFEKYEKFISLSVNHEDLRSIKECYSDLIGYLKENMLYEAKLAKSRLIDALSHLRRLSGVNIDSII